MGAPIPPAHALYCGVSGQFLFIAIPLIALCFFGWTIFRRLRPLFLALPDPRFDRPRERFALVLRNWLLQWKHPRYRLAGLLHIVIFLGFLVLSLRSLSLVLIGIFPGFDVQELLGHFTASYEYIKDYVATAVFAAVVVAAVRRVVFKPKRYQPRPGDTRNHTAEALTVLGLIAALMLSESAFGSGERAPAALTLAGGFRTVLTKLSVGSARSIRLYAYLVHEITFFAFLCFLPFGKHFHVLTSAFNIYLSKLDRGRVKPARWGIAEDQVDDLESLGVSTLQDFTWKHLLDFYSCADCGRCSDNCPAHAAGRPLSPRFLTIKARDACFEAFPVFGRSKNGASSTREFFSEDEIWSCTTCGACEEECPMQVEYIDKIVDLRRALVEDGAVPASLQKPLKALESRGNPFGKLEKRRADWTKSTATQPACEVKVLNKGAQAKTLFFVDSVSSYDDRIQRIARATAQILSASGEDFGILGPAEKDSGHDVRRFGEESLFQALRQQNSEAIRASGVTRIVAADPHALNALRHDYDGLPPVEHVSQFLWRQITSEKLHLRSGDDAGRVVAYHDPCYLGRHNQIYDEPRAVLDAIPGTKRVEMNRCRDRSFCCGGGGLMLNYEAPEKERIGSLRLKMACETGADTIVTACPFCLINLEDAIKVAGLESKMRVMDLTELVLEHMPSPTETPTPVTAAEPQTAMVH
ncbi:MAG TPA: (Fe-S)-binding protein [Candidatus Koribacter sp.]|jgi:Fe-S oxidoreductase